MTRLAIRIAPALAACGSARAQERPEWLGVANALDPRGPVAARIADVWWYLFITSVVVFAIVTALFLIGLFRRGRAVTDGTDTGDRRAMPYILAGTLVTALILLATAVITFVTMRALAAPDSEPVHTFEVVGHQWWWEIRYEGETIGANEIHLPVGEPVEIRLASEDVIHSFWVPELAGKRDLIPGHATSLWLRADEAGVYRGACAEFCGLQHAKMNFLAIAEEPAAFEAWLERARSDAAAPQSDAARAGREVFLREGCAGCHAIRGAGARGRLGPDLTHLASRRTLAAAQMPNTRGHLGGWIVNPQEIKPGNLMPPQDLSGEDLQALLSYLTALE